MATYTSGLSANGVCDTSRSARPYGNTPAPGQSKLLHHSRSTGEQACAWLKDVVDAHKIFVPCIGRRRTRCASSRM